MRLSAIVLTSIVAVAACSQPTAPTSVAPPAASAPVPPPRTGPPPLPTGSFRLTGIITERTPQGDRPVSGANVNAWIQTATVGYSYMYLNGPRFTDAQGRYDLTNLPAGATVQFDTWKDGYVQQCAAPQFVVDADAQINAQLVLRANVSASPDSVPPSAPGFRLISGVVYEVTAESRRPAASAFVDYEPFMDSPAAVTYTDLQGRFLLCGIPQTGTAVIGAGLGGGRAGYQSVPPGGDTHIEIDVK